MKVLEELKYSKTHEWVRYLSDTECEVGITDHAQDSLGDLVFVNLPEGDTCEKGTVVCDVESVKAVSDIYSPVSGTISEVNEALNDEPELINKDPYGAWLYKVTDITDAEELMSAEEYEAFCESEG